MFVDVSIYSLVGTNTEESKTTLTLVQRRRSSDALSNYRDVLESILDSMLGDSQRNWLKDLISD